MFTVVEVTARGEVPVASDDMSCPTIDNVPSYLSVIGIVILGVVEPSTVELCHTMVGYVVAPVVGTTSISIELSLVAELVLFHALPNSLSVGEF